MAVNRAALIEKLNQRSEKESMPSKDNLLRLAPEENRGGRVHRLVELAASLMKEAQVLARDKAFVDESANLKRLDLSKGIDFYNEVQRFETTLIKLALEQSEGNQARAARLLGLRATTLNSKIKLYGIEY
ncbi:MAG TPA: helix-turn-helix domain-containing protein [Pyrinomonadaceae bacterium]|jgi:DNA-binding protein Fis|nr:helix-turn-helix domain-containing protein [Pyrinomonadaceae bacterium]